MCKRQKKDTRTNVGAVRYQNFLALGNYLRVLYLSLSLSFFRRLFGDWLSLKKVCFAPKCKLQPYRMLHQKAVLTVQIKSNSWKPSHSRLSADLHKSTATNKISCHFQECMDSASSLPVVAIAIRLEAIATRVEAIASRAIPSRMEAIARVETQNT